MNRFSLSVMAISTLAIGSVPAFCADAKAPAPRPPAKSAKPGTEAGAAKPAQRQDLFKRASDQLLEALQKLRTLEAETAERRRSLEARLTELSREKQTLERSRASLERRVADLEKDIGVRKEQAAKESADGLRRGEEAARILDEAKKYVAGLEKRVQEGIPWMREQRLQSLSRARAALSDAGLSPSAALEIVNRLQEEEESLGRTVEAGRARIEVGGEARSVPAVRIGLLGVAYASEDGTLVGYAHAGQAIEQGKIEAAGSASGESSDRALQKVSSGYAAALSVLQRRLTPRIVDFFIPGLAVSNEDRR